MLDILKLENFEEGKQAAFYCNTFSKHLQDHREEILVPHKHNFYLTVIFTHGSGKHEIDFKLYDIRPGTVFMLNPGQTHHWELSADAEGYIFFHSQEFFDGRFTKLSVNQFPFFHSVLNSSAAFLDDHKSSLLASYFASLYTAYRSTSSMKLLKVCALINLIYVEITEEYLKEPHGTGVASDRYSRHFESFVRLVESHFIEEKSVAAYAEWLNITQRHLNRITKVSVGKSPSDLITERTILEARRLLYYTNDAVSEIAWNLGYEDKAYFSRQFKQYTGLSPKAFQKQYKAE